MLIRLKEGSNATLTATFFDAAKEPTIPQSVEYRIDCVENKEQIRDWTSIPPASEVSIDLTPEDNACVIPARGVEKHEVTMRAGYGVNDYSNSSFTYEVSNLRFLQA